ncbi:MAG: hypothetical protein IPG12_07050 [Saprospiraceae bacterium]|nr:hypothetical protein [Saprospiraceae bacterium]
MEPSKILNLAESLLFTPYEFGGKNPNKINIGLIKNNDKYWRNNLLPYLRNLSIYHPDNYEECTPEQRKVDYKEIKNFIYNKFAKLTSNNSLGIDCSGFVYSCYLEDKTLLINPKKLNTGSFGQLEAFMTAEKEGKAYVHNNFNIISAGDFIHKKGHVMIATGKVKLDNSGNVVEYETIEANSTDKGVITLWRKVEDSKAFTIAHPFRDTDRQELVIPVFEFESSKNKSSKNQLTSAERVVFNLEQEVIK